MPQTGQGTCAIARTSLEAAFVLYHILLDVLQDGEPKEGKALPRRLLAICHSGPMGPDKATRQRELRGDPADLQAPTNA